MTLTSKKNTGVDFVRVVVNHLGAAAAAAGKVDVTDCLLLGLKV